MKLIIDLPEKLYNYMKSDNYDEHLDRRFDYKVRFAVKEGIPLPKGHGRLVEFVDVPISFDDDSGTENVSIADVFTSYYKMKNAPIIIEADAGETE